MTSLQSNVIDCPGEKRASLRRAEQRRAPASGPGGGAEPDRDRADGRVRAADAVGVERPHAPEQRPVGQRVGRELRRRRRRGPHERRAKLELSSTSITYQAAFATSLQSNVNGWVTVAPAAGLTATARPATGGGGGVGVDCTVIVRTSDHAPGVPSQLSARTRQNQLPSGSALVVNCEAVVLALRISGAPNAEISSTWIV